MPSTGEERSCSRTWRESHYCDDPAKITHSAALAFSFLPSWCKKIFPRQPLQRFRGKPIKGAVRQMLVIRSVQHSSEGSYRCFVSVKDCDKPGVFTAEAFLRIDPQDFAVEQRLVQHMLSVDAHLEHARIHDAAAQAQKALSDKSTQLYPELHFQLLQSLAIAKCQLSDIRGAIADLSKALSLSVSRQDAKIQDCVTAALQLRAKLYLQVQPPRYTDAISDLEKVLSRTPPKSRGAASAAASATSAG